MSIDSKIGMKTICSKRYVTTFLLIAIASLAPSAFTEPALDVTLQLKWNHQFQFAGYYAALEQGFYQEEGLNVSLIEGGAEIPVAKIVASGEADFGVLGSELILERIQGKPLVMLAVIFQHSARALMVREDSGITSPSDFVGQQFMLNILEGAEFWAMFLREGISREALDVIQKDGTATSKLVSGEIAAMNGSIGNQPFEFRQRNVPIRLIRAIDYGIDFYGDALFTSENFLKDHPDQVASVRRATIRGWEYAMTHVDETITLILNKYAREKTREQLQFEAESMRALILPELVDVGHVNPDRVRRIAETYAKLGLTISGHSLDGFIFDQNSPSPFRWSYVLLIGFAGLASAAFIAALAWIWNRQLRSAIIQRTRELSESEERFRMICDNAPVLINAFDEEGHCTLWNKQCRETFGWTIDEVNAHGDALSLFYPDPAVHDEVLRMINSDPDGYFREWRPVTKEGKTLTTVWANFRLPNGMVFSLGHDITERKKVEQQRDRLFHNTDKRMKELRCSSGVAESIRSRDTLEQIFKNVVELIPPGWKYPEITRARIHFNDQEYVSQPFAETQWRQGADIVVGSEPCGRVEVFYVEACPESDEGPFLKEEQNLIEGIARTLSEAAERYQITAELELHRKSLEDQVQERTSQLDVRVNESEKLNSAMVNVMEDLRSSNEGLEAAGRRLIASNKELDTFSYSVSHDLRAPLRHIDGFIKLLFKRGMEHLDPTSARYLEIIAESSNRMGRLIDDLLAFSRMGRTESHFQRVDSNKLVQETLKELSPLMEDRRIAWEVGELPVVEADRSLLQLVWGNLIGNALKYTAPCEGVRIEIGAIRAEGEEGVGEITFFIRDNGVGFDPQYTGKLFGVFQRLHRDDEFEGTGIGLATVHRIVHRHGGRVWAEGKVGHGAAFYFTLKAAKEKDDGREKNSMGG